ncbi:MAG: DUF3131 domain-containing protein [Gemmatimonadaceae bacterium]|nr:DUF3131 domain-containing protein [Gemmatimonadaceae bacterium]
MTSSRLLAGVVLVLAACAGNADDGPLTNRTTAALTATTELVADSTPSDSTPSVDPELRAHDDRVFAEAADAAWRFIDRNYAPATGFIRAFEHYPVSTIWDIASGIGALFSAAELGLVPMDEYHRRTARALHTLGTLPLFEGGFNKEYRVDNGAVIGIERTPARRGYGVSATDHGRLLIWLRIVAQRHPVHRPAVDRIVQRLALASFTGDGYLKGRQLSRRTGRTLSFQEGRLGYEQYAARGFALWGVTAGNALDIERNLQPRDVEGVQVPGDKRGNDRLTSEPFVLLGIEVGFTPAEQQAALAVLAAQEARYRRTGTLTLVSEDAIDVAPDYFFYYTVLSRHGPFTLEVQRPNVRPEQPRWVSTKAAFGWHALAPSPYTRQVVDSLSRVALVRGIWGSGMFEGGGATGNPNVNTASVVLEAALHHRVGRPLLDLPPVQ